MDTGMLEITSYRSDGEPAQKDEIGIVFPRWLGDCIMARGAMNYAAQLFPSIKFTAIIDEEKRSALKINNAVFGFSESNTSSLSHNRFVLPILVNEFIRCYTSRQNLLLLKRYNFKSVFFLRKDRSLKDYFIKNSYFYEENILRTKKDNLKKHRVTLMSEFIVDSLEKMSYHPESEADYNRDYKLDDKYLSELCIKGKKNWPEVDDDKLKISVFPFASNHDKYKGWGKRNTAKLISLIQQKWPGRVQVILGGHKNKKRIAKYIDNNVHTKENFFNTITHRVDVNHSRKSSQLKLFLQLMSLMDYVVTIDSGSLHIAEYLNIPSCGIYGPTHPHETGPFTEYYGNNYHVMNHLRNDSINERVLKDKQYNASLIEAAHVFNIIQDHIEKLNLFKD